MDYYNVNKLIFPKSIRLARGNEIPGPDKEEELERIRNAKIEPGYIVKKSNDPMFKFYFEANVDAPEIWPVFRKLCESILGDHAVLIIDHSDEEPENDGQYHATIDLLNLLETHSYKVVNYGWIQLGLAEQTEESIDEVFITACKYFKVFTNHDSVVRDIFHEFGIQENPEIQFIDEFSRVTKALKEDGITQDSSELINSIRQSASDLS